MLPSGPSFSASFQSLSLLPSSPAHSHFLLSLSLDRPAPPHAMSLARCPGSPHVWCCSALAQLCQGSAASMPVSSTSWAPKPAMKINQTLLVSPCVCVCMRACADMHEQPCIPVFWTSCLLKPRRTKSRNKHGECANERLGLYITAKCSSPGLKTKRLQGAVHNLVPPKAIVVFKGSSLARRAVCTAREGDLIPC